MSNFIAGLNFAEEAIEKCTFDDVELHYQTVSAIVLDTDEVAFKDLMKETVIDGTAYKTKDNSCFLYYLKQTDYEALGICFHGKDNPKSMLTLLAGVFNVVEPLLNIMRFTPHTDSDISSFKSLMMLSSIKKHYQKGTPLVLRIDLLRNKIKSIVQSRST